MASTARLRPHRAALVASALLLAPLVGACSSGGSEDDPTPATTTTQLSGGDVTTTTSGDDPDPDGTTTVPDDTTTTTKADGPDVEPAGDARAYRDALVAAFLDEGNTDLPLDREQAECIAPRWIDALGAGRFIDAGIAPDDLTDATGDSYFDLIDGIGDAETAEQLAASFAECDIDLTELVAGLVDDDGAATPAQIACFVDAIPEGAIEASLASALDGDDTTEADFDDEVADAAESCFG